MTSSVMGYWNPGIGGGVATFNAPVNNVGGVNVDAAVGAFTGTADLPATIESDEDFLAFVTALLAKTTETNGGGAIITNLLARKFVGVGAGGGDVITAVNAEAGRFWGGGGDDFLASLTLEADDTLNGGDGNDRLAGAGGRNALIGGEGDDTLHSEVGDDTLVGGAGADTAYFRDGHAATVSLAIVGPQATGSSTGTDVLVGIENLRGGAFGDTLTGDHGANRLSGDGGDDTLDGGAGDDRLDGGAGVDTAVYSAAGAAVTLSLAVATAQATGGAGQDTLTGVENLLGSAFNDALTGQDGENRLEGGGGRDTLNGGPGDDTLDGGLDFDSADYRDVAAGPVTVNLLDEGPQATGGAGTDTLIGIEGLIGSSFRDVLSGDVGANRLDGRGGSDILHGRGGNDTLIGAAGKDLIDGNVGADRMTGGPGKDRYYYDAPDELEAAEPDIVTDLTAEDRILLTSIDAKADKAGNQAFDLVEALTGRSGQAALVYDAGQDVTELRLDMDGDGLADGVILLLGDHRDFINFAL